MVRGRSGIIVSTLVCRVCDNKLTCFLFKNSKHVNNDACSIISFYFNMLIYVEIDVCVVPNWSYVMICDRKFNLKTTCVKSNICDSFSIYIS